MDDGNTLHGMELALSIFTFPVWQQSFYPAIIGRNNGVVNLFKTTQQAARRREELSNNLITTRGHRLQWGRRRIPPVHVELPAIPVTPLPTPSSFFHHVYTVLGGCNVWRDLSEVQCGYAMNVWTGLKRCEELCKL